MIKTKGIKGQVTIFVLVAILIVIAIVFLFMLLKGPIKIFTQQQSQEPNQEIEQCIKKSIEKASDLIIENAGYIENPPLTLAVGYHLGERDEIPYRNYTFLCYTPRNRIHCIPTNAVFLEHIREELVKYLEPKINDCFIVAKHNLEGQGYNVKLENNINFSVEIVPRKIVVSVQREMEILKSDESKKFTKFISTASSPLYDFSEIIQEIVSQEAEYCNSEYVELMRIYRDFEISKFQTGNDIRIYTIEDDVSDKIFRFLTRGCVIPTPG